MDVYEAIRARHSVRSYADREVAQEVVERVFDAVRLAPSARNLQPWKFILVRDPDLRAKLAHLCWGQSFIAEAPIVVVGCGLPTEGFIGGYSSSMQVDAAIAFDHLTLAATAEGLGTCWIGAFDNTAVKRLLGIPEEVQVVAISPLGYPGEASSAPPKSRKPLAAIVSYDRY